MTPFDLTLLLLLSNAVQNAMTGPDTSVWRCDRGASHCWLMNYLVAELSGSNRRFRKLVQGQPSFWCTMARLSPPHGQRARQHGRAAMRSSRARHCQPASGCAGRPRSRWLDQLPEIRRDQAHGSISSGAKKVSEKAPIAFRGSFELQQHDLGLGSDPQRRPPRACSVGCVYQKISQAL